MTKNKELIQFLFPMALLLLIFILIWLKEAGFWVYGLYADVDGQLFAWQSKAFIEWSKPFDIWVLNPLSGMTSLFLPYGSWWNPGALALLFPFSTLTNYIISYSLYWIEMTVALYLLARTIGLSNFKSLISCQLFVLFLFPPFYTITQGMPLYSLAPFYIHLVAIACFITVLYAKLGIHPSFFKNVLIIALLGFSILIFFLSGALFTIFFLPIYGVICLGLTFDSFNKRSVVWRAIAVALIASILFSLDFFQYFKVMGEFSTRSLMLDGSSELISIHFPKQWKNIGICSAESFRLHPFSILCAPMTSLKFIYLFSFLGGLLLLLSSKKYRFLALSFCFVAVLPILLWYLIVQQIIQGRIATLNFSYSEWAAQPYFFIFSILFFSTLFGCFQKMSRKLSCFFLNNKFYLNCTALLKMIDVKYRNLYKLFVLMIIPCISLCFFISFAPNALKESAVTPSIDYLRNHISLKSDTAFRGSVATYFASSGSTLRKMMKIPNEAMSSFEHYIQARHLLKSFYNNMHMFSDLWNYGIPTIEDYAQMVNIPIYAFFQNLLSEKSDLHHPYFINVHKLDLKILRAMGARFLISDKQLIENDISLILEQKDFIQSPVLYLYEIKNSNIASYSPIQAIIIKKAKEIFLKMKENAFSFENSFITQENIPYDLVKAKQSRMRFERNSVRIQAESNGWSVLILPLQYSHCLEVRGEGSHRVDNNVRLFRANLIQSGLLFKDQINIKIAFESGMNTQCRREDIQDVNEMEVYGTLQGYVDKQKIPSS